MAEIGGRDGDGTGFGGRRRAGRALFGGGTVPLAGLVGVRTVFFLGAAVVGAAALGATVLYRGVARARFEPAVGETTDSTPPGVNVAA